MTGRLRPPPAVGHAAASLARTVLGALWLHEAWVKYHAGFGAADIRLVTSSIAANPRVPDVYRVLGDHLVAPNAGVLGVAVPLLEATLGVLLICGIGTTAAAAVSALTLTVYWQADQLIWEYPPMMVLSVLTVLARPAASAWSLPALFARRGIRRRRNPAPPVPDPPSPAVPAPPVPAPPAPSPTAPSPAGS